MAQVLVAEGDAGIREAIQAALEDEGHHIMTAANGAFALTRLRASTDPLVVLVNERLSDIGGLAILHMAADVRIGLLSRHSYILMTALPYCLSDKSAASSGVTAFRFCRSPSSSTTSWKP